MGIASACAQRLSMISIHNFTKVSKNPLVPAGRRRQTKQPGCPGYPTMELVVFDLDGTLLNRESAISDYTSETLKRLS
jgi:hypothetical protein